MSSLTKILRYFAALIGVTAAGLASGAHAQTSPCGVIGISANATPVAYDPFNPTGLSSSSVVMTISRVNISGGGKTDTLNLFLRASPSTGTAANGIQLIPISLSGQGSIEGQGLNIFYDTPVSQPTLTPAELSPTSGNRFLKVNFNGNADSADSVTITFNVVIPPNLNVNASQTLAFDAQFVCKVSGGSYNKQTLPGTSSNAVVFPVTVLSALRTYYAGTALAFGEIGAIPAVPLSPVRTDAGNYVFVQSSGAYSVTLSSQNAFKMKKPGAVSVNDEIRYSLKFLGDTRSTATTPTPGQTAINHQCMRAGMAASGQHLPIQATLIDGGQFKNPSPNYSDILTVTITPLAYAITGVDDCGSFTVP
ncbi:MAG: hypothetical protein ACKOPG_12825 [Novosphingobium sp.]